MKSILTNHLVNKSFIGWINKTLGVFVIAMSLFVTPIALANPEYDEQKANQVGADEYGMKRYVMAFLRKGPNRDMPKQQAEELQAAHMANIGRLADEGKLVLAGPFFGDGKLRGIYIFDVETVEQAKALTQTDPAIKAGRLTMELLPWYGSAALMEVNQLHKQVAKTLF